MAKNSIRDYDATSGNNTDVQSVDISEGCAASGINNAIREVMADLKDVSTGTVNLETPAADRLDVDNIRIDGNTISSTDTNGDITLDPNGTGDVIVASGEVGVGTTTPATYTDYVSGSNAPSVVVAGSQPSYVLADTDISGNDGTLGITKAGEDTVINNLGAGNVRISNNGSERMRIDSSGALLIGKTSLTSNDAGLELNTGANANVARVDHHKTASGDFAGYYFFHNGSNVGGIDYSDSAVNYATSSDHRLKENVADMTGAITRVKALSPKRFNFIIDPDKTVDGFLAHEAQTVVPEAVRGTHNEVDEDGNAVMQGIDQSKLVPLLTGALQEAIAKIETLETEMTALKARVTALEA